MSKTRYALTLTCEADSPEDLLKLLDFKKKDLYPLEISLAQIKDTLEHAASLPGVTLAGKSGAVKYVVEASRVKEGPRTDEVVPAALPALSGCATRCRPVDEGGQGFCDNLADCRSPRNPRPEGCLFEKGGGLCAGAENCNRTGVCATKGKENG